MVYFINFFSDPFYAIFGTKWWSMGLCYSFFISMSVLLMTAVNYFGGLSDNCKATMKDIKTNVKTFEKYLQTMNTSDTSSTSYVPITQIQSGSVQAPDNAPNTAVN
jgi:archaellum component FlaF (FlaF/FlaG flagellin family)